MSKNIIYVIYDRRTTLPVAEFESRFLARCFFGCGRTTFWKMEKLGENFPIDKAPYAWRYYYVMPVEIPTDEEIENWFLTTKKDCDIMDSTEPRVADAPQLYKIKVLYNWGNLMKRRARCTCLQSYSYYSKLVTICQEIFQNFLAFFYFCLFLGVFCLFCLLL